MKGWVLTLACRFLFCAALVACGMHAVNAAEQDEEQNADQKNDRPEVSSDTPRQLPTVEVTATKKTTKQSVQEVSFAITAFGPEKIEAMKVRTLQDLSFAAPNVSLADVGTSEGIANFTIRGLGINSSIPSIDPAVGVFIDGVYLGINAGVVLDIFDIARIEILRGPQGVLFGRNVTGGAVLIHTRRPDPGGAVRARFAVDSGFRGTGLNYYAMGSISDSIGGGWSAKLAAYYNKDEGWFTNLATGENFGKSETKLVHTALMYTGADHELILRYHHGSAEGQGPASQNRALFSRHSFDFAIDLPGFYDNSWDMVIFEGNWEVDFGDGRITNIFGWRQYSSRGASDIDSLPFGSAGLGLPQGLFPFFFHAALGIEQEQFSNELRYAGTFGEDELTVGLYYFTQDLRYQETRYLPVFGGPPTFPGADLAGGGIQHQYTWAVFGQLTHALSETLDLIVGARYTYEKKDVKIATLLAHASIPSINHVVVPVYPGGCNVLTGDCNFDFIDSQDWNKITPKIGLSWEPNENVQVYGYLTRGFRSGGYNMRNTSPTAPPGPYGPETLDALELGLKYQKDRQLRWNTAVFYYRMHDMQRAVNLADPTTGVVQIIKNTADATIYGFESELSWVIGNGFRLMAAVGYTHGEYTDVRYDISGDGVVDEKDLALDIPRLAPWTYSIGGAYNYRFDGGGLFSARLRFSHRDRAAYTDNNLGYLNATDMVNAGVSYTSADGSWQLSLYGDNLLNEVTAGGDTQVPFPPPTGGTFSPLNKGRVIGMELELRWL